MNWLVKALVALKIAAKWSLSALSTELAVWIQAIVAAITAAAVWFGGIVTGPYGFVVGIVVAVVADSITGALAARKRNERVSSTEWSHRTVIKLAKYAAVLVFVALIETILTSSWTLTVSKWFGTWYVLAGEAISVIENMVTLGWIKGKNADKLIDKLGIEPDDISLDRE